MSSSSNIKLTDRDNDGNLENYSYIYCDNNSDQNTKSCRGLIYKNGKPFVKAYGYTPTYTMDTLPQELINVLQYTNNFRFFYSLEGTLLRLFYNDINDQWYLSTHKKLNARLSKWGHSKTFGEIFDSHISQDFYNKLNKDYIYLLILTPSKQNRMICNKHFEQIYHVGTYDKDFNLSYDYDIGLNKPLELKFEDLDQIKKFVDNENWINSNMNVKYQGIIVCDIKSQTNIKIYNNTYKKLLDIRGNVPSIKFRYLQLRTDETNNKIFRNIFGDYNEEFNKYESIIKRIGDKLFDIYMLRYIKKQRVLVSHEEHNILKSAHEWHNEDKQNNKMSKTKIYEIIDSKNPVLINSMIKQFTKSD